MTDPNSPLLGDDESRQFTDLSSLDPETQNESYQTGKTERKPETLTDSQIEECNRAFNRFDINGDGCISADELATAMRSLGQNPSKQEVQRIIASVPGGLNNNVITKQQFITMLSKSWKSMEDTKMELLAAFQIFDSDGNGKIIPQELKNVICKLGEKLEEEEVDYLFEMADVNKDGVVDYEEFVNVIVNLNKA